MPSYLGPFEHKPRENVQKYTILPTEAPMGPEHYFIFIFKRISFVVPSFSSLGSLLVELQQFHNKVFLRYDYNKHLR
jgi:hypothetical protein